jgi:hypothetical protein
VQIAKHVAPHYYLSLASNIDSDLHLRLAFQRREAVEYIAMGVQNEPQSVRVAAALLVSALTDETVGSTLYLTSDVSDPRSSSCFHACL